MQKLYGRRKGKKLRPRQDSLVETLLPKLSLNIAADAVDPHILFPFKADNVRLEIGFGDGERLIAQAMSYPSVGFIGCEPFVNGVAKTLAAIDDLGLENIRLHCGDARDLLTVLPASSIDQIELLYPDPWPKLRHRKRRIVSRPFIAALARVLKPGAHWRFATDIDDYAAWTLARVLPSDQFIWLAQKPADWLVPWDGWFPTRYEMKARKEGRASAYCTFLRV